MPARLGRLTPYVDSPGRGTMPMYHSAAWEPKWAAGLELEEEEEEATAEPAFEPEPVQLPEPVPVVST